MPDRRSLGKGRFLLAHRKSRTSVEAAARVRPHPGSRAVSTHRLRLATAMIKHCDQKQRGEQRVYFIFHVLIVVHHEVRSGTRGRQEPKQKSRGLLLTGVFPRLAQPVFFLSLQKSHLLTYLFIYLFTFLYIPIVTPSSLSPISPSLFLRKGEPFP